MYSRALKKQLLKLNFINTKKNAVVVYAQQMPIAMVDKLLSKLCFRAKYIAVALLW